MQLCVRRLGYSLGASVEGVDLSQEIDAEMAAALRALWLEHIVLCFPRQRIDPLQFRSFAARFGELDDFRTSQYRHPQYDNVMLVSSVPTQIGATTMAGLRFGQTWHSDNAYTRRPAEATFLLAQDLPGTGGDTMFANLYAAYEALSPKLQALLAGLDGVQDYTMTGNFTNFTPEQRARSRELYPPVAHPLARTHPETGRVALFIDQRVRSIDGMTDDESRVLLEYLVHHAVRPEFVYRHRWSPGDLIMWDNRCAIHIAVQDYDRQQTRRMLRCTALGPPTGRIRERASSASAQ